MQIEADIARCDLFMQLTHMIKIDIEKNKVTRVEILPTMTDETGFPMMCEDYANVIKDLKENISTFKRYVNTLQTRRYH